MFCAVSNVGVTPQTTIHNKCGGFSNGESDVADDSERPFWRFALSDSTPPLPRMPRRFQAGASQTTAYLLLNRTSIGVVSTSCNAAISRNSTHDDAIVDLLELSMTYYSLGRETERERQTERQRDGGHLVRQHDVDSAASKDAPWY